MGKKAMLYNAKILRDVETGEMFVQPDYGDELIPMSGGGGAPFKAFDVALADNAHLNIVDMGNDLVSVTFTLKDNQTPAKDILQYMIPADDAEFTNWIKDKVLVLSVSPVVGIYGKTGNQGTYCCFDYLGMIGGAETDLGGGFMLMPNFGGKETAVFTDEQLQMMYFSTVARLGGSIY